MTRSIWFERLIVFGVLVALVSVALYIAFSNRAGGIPTMAALQGLSRDRFEAAVQAFKRDRKAEGSALTVALRDLVSGGYLRSADIRGLEGRDVTVSLAIENAAPLEVWIAVRESDGSQIALLGNGRIAVSPPQTNTPGLSTGRDGAR